MNESLLMRKKGQHLSDAQVFHIIKQLDSFPKSVKLLQKMYKLSQATMRRIINFKNKNKQFEDIPLSRFQEKKRISKEAKLTTRSYLLPPCEPKSIPIIKKYIEAELGESYQISELRNFIKKEMKYSYKKGNSRPPIYKENRTQLKKALFCIELLSLIACGGVVINWDESSFDRSIKQQYSWLPVGQSCQIINDRLKGRASLILATWNTGEWFSVIFMSTINSDKFWFFLTLLSGIISRRFTNFKKPPVVIIDNASTHKSGITQKIIDSLDLQVKFNAAYWPEIAPVERIFGMMKSKMRRLGGSMTIDFSKRKDAEQIFMLINSIGESSLIKAWREVIREARKTIIEMLTKKRINNEMLLNRNQIELESMQIDRTGDISK